jgi:hypothetical protein
MNAAIGGDWRRRWPVMGQISEPSSSSARTLNDRTFAVCRSNRLDLEALERLRPGKQKVTVQHVTVTEANRLAAIPVADMVGFAVVQVHKLRFDPKIRLRSARPSASVIWLSCTTTAWRFPGVLPASR